MEAREHDDEQSARGAYWNDFYQSREAPLVPSQFAVFMLGEAPPGAQIVDLGCGTGRDSLFLASIGRDVVGVDGSIAAIQSCRETARSRGLRSAKFLASPVDSSELAGGVEAASPASSSKLRLVYARFFLHAITDGEEAAFLRLARTLCTGGGMLAVEFRTLRDAQQAKVTAAHFRRFINPLDLIERAREHGFRCDYFVEGFGYAKYKDDDAHVARCIFRLG